MTAAVLGWLLGSEGGRNGVRGAGGRQAHSSVEPERTTATAGPPDEPASTEAGSASAPDDGESTVERWVRLATGVIAPTTVLTALLFYFGYVATTAEYRYFGITLGTLGLSTQEVVLRSVAALYVPLGALLVLLLSMSWMHHTVSRWLAAETHTRSLRRAGVVLAALGTIGFARGVVGVAVPEVARTEPVAVSPTCLGLGVVTIAYGRYLLLRTAAQQRDPRETVWARRGGLLFTAGLVTLSLFWATNSFAGAYGRGRAVYVADRLGQDRPAVVLDTTERMFADYTGIDEVPLPAEDDQRFRYRYYGFRLLVQAGDRMFLLPERWQVEDGTTLVVQVGDDVRFFLYR